MFKMLLAGFGSIFVPLILIGGVSSFLGYTTWTQNGEQLHGVSILLSALMFSVLMPVGFAFMMSGVAFLGQLIFSKFKPITIKVLTD
jgi:hypothetical protein